jgi:hypothetical protein
VQDNNLLACGTDHIYHVFEMLRKQNKAVTFSGGIDVRLLNKWHIDLFNSIKIHELWFACDQTSQLQTFERAANLLHGITQNKKRCYVMIGYNEYFEEAEMRLRTIYELGFLPFAQLYQPENKISYSDDWKKLNRHWSRPAIYRSVI